MNSIKNSARHPNSTPLILTALAALTLSPGRLASQQIAVPNGSFESQSGEGMPFGVNVLLDSWEKPPNPGYPEGGTNNFFWIQSAGAFVGTAPSNPNPYSNLLGTQAAYLLALPGAGLFQDNRSTDWSGATNGLNATFQVGMSYDLTIGLFGKEMDNDFSSLELSLYYRDDADFRTNVASTTVVFNTNTFNPAGPFTLQDYSVNVPIVQAGDPWAGKNIGISISAVQGTGAGYWDMDNVRLTAVPEPSAWVLAVGGLAGGWLVQRRLRRRG